jgi:hypothetical protein
VDLYPELPSLTPWGGAGLELLVDYRPQWPWVVASTFTNLNNGVSFLFFTVAGLAGRGELVRPAWIYIFAIAMLFDTASAIYYILSPGNQRDAAASALVIPENALMAIGVFYRECHMLDILLVFGCLSLVARFLIDLAVFRAGLMQIVIGNIVSPGVAAIFFAVVLIALRRRDITLARRLIIPDYHRYESLWATVATDPQARQGLEDLCTCAVHLTQALPSHPPRQHIKRSTRAGRAATIMRPPTERDSEEPTPPPGGGGGSSWRGRPFLSLSRGLAGACCLVEAAGGAPGEDHRTLADCLDQLFVQVTAVDTSITI